MKREGVVHVKGSLSYRRSRCQSIPNDVKGGMKYIAALGGVCFRVEEINTFAADLAAKINKQQDEDKKYIGKRTFKLFLGHFLRNYQHLHNDIHN